MVNRGFKDEINLLPKYGYCNDVKVGTFTTRKIVWLVPHVIRHREDDEVITWRCNWGNVCGSKCVYAMAKTDEGNLDSQEAARKTDFLLTR